MYNNNDKDKHYVSARNGRKRRKNLLLVIALGLVVCCIASGITLAYVFTNTDPVKNEFTPAKVACEVIEEFDGTNKNNVRIKNTGETESYIRAAVVVTWMSEDGSQVTAAKPVAGTDYTITFAGETSNWKLSSDGFWYYTVPVEVGAETVNLIDTCTCIGTPPTGFYLSVEIVASSIQSSPTTVVVENWSSGVNGVNGTTLVIKQGE